MQPLFPSVVTAALVIYSWARRALTLNGIAAAVLIAFLNAFHPWGVFFCQLVVFFMVGTLVTKLKHTYKSALTTSSDPASKNEPEARSALQVFANSLPASLLVLFHALYMHYRLAIAPDFLIAMPGREGDPFAFPPVCFDVPTESAVGRNPYYTPLFTHKLMNVVPWGIMASYAAAAADTFASELGMLAISKPVFLPSLLRGRVERVPPGTNGGITLEGVLASALGAFFIAITAVAALPLCQGTGPLDIVETRAAYIGGYMAEGLSDKKRWSSDTKTWLVVYVTVAGVLGALFDSLLGATCQASIVDAGNGKVVEGQGGEKLVRTAGQKPEYKLIKGTDWLSNNGVNLAMTAGSAVLAIITMAVVTR